MAVITRPPSAPRDGEDPRPSALIAPAPRPRRPRSGEYQPAGRILVTIVVALVLAALVNADAMVVRAERMPLGARRDRSLMVWHAVADVSHVLQLHRIRDLADAIAGSDDPSDPSVPVALPPAAVEEALPRVRPTLRQPTADAKLRLYIGGDSVVRDMGESLIRAANATGLVDPNMHYQIASGLARPDYYNWPAALASDMKARQPEVVVIMFGGNDAQGMQLADGTVYPDVTDRGWQIEYARRVGAVMDQLHARDRLVVWVGQPVMRDPGFSHRMDILDDIYEAEAAGRPWVEFVDSRPLFADSSGGYADYLPNASGDLQDVRQSDGIHLSRTGADRLAGVILDLLRRDVALP
jgi:hypothetical protein